MENLVITFKYDSGDIKQIMSMAEYEKINKIFGRLGFQKVLMDDKHNCLNMGVNPNQVLVDKYENAKLVAVQSLPGTLSYMLGEAYDYQVEGKKLDNVLDLVN